MKITLIGSGNTASVLGRRIYQGGHIIHQVYSRHIQHAKELADELNANAVDKFEEIDKNADLYLICLADKALLEMVNQIHLPGRLVAHTAGSVSIHILSKLSDQFGVVYPLQTLRKELPGSPVLPIFVDGNNEWTKTKLEAFAQSFADSVHHADDEQRSKLHLAAVIANNFSNYLFQLTEKYCVDENIDFKILIPLIDETTRRLHLASPAEVQTGPAIRKDHETIGKHLKMLQHHPELKKTYEWFTRNIMQVNSE